VLGFPNSSVRITTDGYWETQIGRDEDALAGFRQQRQSDVRVAVVLPGKRSARVGDPPRVGDGPHGYRTLRRKSKSPAPGNKSGTGGNKRTVQHRRTSMTTATKDRLPRQSASPTH
jgi:hypothetical protein